VLGSNPWFKKARAYREKVPKGEGEVGGDRQGPIRGEITTHGAEHTTAVCAIHNLPAPIHSIPGFLMSQYVGSRLPLQCFPQRFRLDLHGSASIIAHGCDFGLRLTGVLEYWSTGVVEYCVRTSSCQNSITPLLRISHHEIHESRSATGTSLPSREAQNRNSVCGPSDAAD